ncbi:MAG TPA: LacI family DNA-binding transcriptional regulator [Prolixibacteraceae bacterium]|nr:LacI family DNA-binding transcriptional regulator [Prolixibacteraceae bacterium]
MENKKTTIHDIAAHLNMSASTVSRALGNYSRISKKTRELVQQTARELNYRPNQLASNLRKGKGKLIGVIIPRINRHFFSHAIAGMETITNPAGYNLMICQTNENAESEQQSLQTLIGNRVDGVIVSMAAGTKNLSHFEQAANEGVPLVFFDRYNEQVDADRVVNDNFSGAYEVIRHLIDQGYKRIVHFAGPQHINVYAHRFQGYKKAIEEAGLAFETDFLVPDCLTRISGESIAQKMIDDKNLPDAIFSASDYSALGALLVFKRNGIKIPQELGIAGFANEPFTEFVDPPMTTLEQFSEEIGQSAARMLIDRLENEHPKKYTSTVSFKPKLIVRESTLRTKNK